MTHMVNCVKLGRELPGLDKAPYPGELGQRIYENVSAEAWEMWLEHATILINHYNLTLFDPRAQEFMQSQAEEFFFGPEAAMPEGWTPSTAGKGGRKK